MKVGVVGASGYVGGELLRLLVAHPKIDLSMVTSRQKAGEYVHRVHPSLKGFVDITFSPMDMEKLTDNCDLVFTSVPHGKANKIVKDLYDRGMKVIDLSADFRLKNPKDYVKWYGWEHPFPEMLSKSVYGVPELHREEIKNAQLVSCPGCMAVTSLLALTPLIENDLIDTEHVVVDSKIGSSGAGQKANAGTHHAMRYGVVRPYKPAKHRHTGEIEQELSMVAKKQIKVSMSPHAVNIVRGIPTTLADIKAISGKEKLVFVHGGGKEVTSTATKLGKEQKFIVSPGGVRSRYTDKETADIYTMVMSGKINKVIVGMLLRQGIMAVGVAGIDGGILKAERKKKLLIINEKGRKMMIDGGYTGKINAVDPSLVHNLVSNGYVPVVSPIALSEEYDFLNVDGDRAAAYVAGGVKADKVIFITNVNGLMLNEKLVTSMTLDQAKAALPKIGFGMEKKVLACTEALEMGVKEAIIASGQIDNPISSAIAHNNCTVITPK